jgi:TatA/E family protein of Tat protein translocase
MLSIPHMIVVFIVVLVVFGPQKLPELARSLGKLMAEFRKASGDFKSAFEDEMRDLERQARVAELKKQAAEATAAAADGAKNPVPAATLGSPAGTEASPESTADNRQTEAPVLTPAADTVARLDASEVETIPNPDGSTSADEQRKATPAAEGNSSPSHDQQQPA